jgi:hypothetical protein
MTIRSTRSGFRVLFDAPDPEVPTPTRNVSTVAPQSLFLLNDPFVLTQAQTVAARVMQVSSDDPEARIRFLYQLLYGRDPIASEIEVANQFLQSSADDAAHKSAWQQYCQILLCANEFIYVD